MGLIAERWADQITVTDDNPRRENASAITQQIIVAMGGNKHRVINDRAQAIHAALRQARAGDTVLIAGKGHEDYQIIGDQRLEFSDYEVAAAALRDWPSC
jgi:UDP-N-acetylmuramoyl-L-alanyl-D-glutamate--2,6-diaminopimelate ligase